MYVPESLWPAIKEGLIETRKSLKVPNTVLRILGPPGSGSASQRYGFGSGSFYHQAKIARKTLIHLFCDFDFLSLKKDVNVPSKSNKQNNFKKISF
jgi:hypothetical protein